MKSQISNSNVSRPKIWKRFFSRLLTSSISLSYVSMKCSSVSKYELNQRWAYVFLCFIVAHTKYQLLIRPDRTKSLRNFI